MPKTGVESHLPPGQDFFGPRQAHEAQTALLTEWLNRKDEALSVSRPGEPATFPEGEDLDSLLEKVFVEVDRLEADIQDPKLVASKVVEFINSAAPDLVVAIEGVEGRPDLVAVHIPYVLGGGFPVYKNIEPYSGMDSDE